MDLLVTLVQIFLLVNISDAGLLGLLFGNKGSKSESESEKVLECKDSCYRTYDGSCNNLYNPMWGTPNSIYIRMFNCTSYKDGIYEINDDLINVRKLSIGAFPDIFIEDLIWTGATPMWGQFVAHDFGRTLGSPQAPGDDISCQCVDGQLTDAEPESDRCSPIEVPSNDPYHASEGTECFDFIRTISTYDTDPNTRAEQFNAVTSFLDGSPIYGNSEEEAESLRTFEYGMLESQNRGGIMYPPESDTPCRDVGASENICLRTGDVRVNQNPHLALIHTILLRHHNAIAKTLCKDINPHWDDEKCYQEARRINIATIQHITYNEYLEIVIGKENVYDKIIKSKHLFHDDYDKSCDPSTINEFAHAAFRNLHSGIIGFIRLFNQYREEEGSRLRLSDHLGNPSILIQNDTELRFATGVVTQRQLKIDRFVDDEVTLAFFRNLGEILGGDLISIDLYRTRDHGLAPYHVALKECGLSKPKCWDDYTKYIKKELVELLKTFYDSYEDVELYAGGSFETRLPGTLMGPTFNCITVKQFERAKRCDRYWYTNKDQKCPFTKDQLKSIKKGSTISSLMCNYVSGLDTIQKRGFEVVSDSNPLVDCEDLPTIDLELWQEDD